MLVKQIVNCNKAAFHQNNHYLNRPRINILLEKAIQYPLVIVYAGTGYGKTYAVHSFLQKRGNTYTSWAQMNEETNDPLYFWKNYTKLFYLSQPKEGIRLLEMGLPETKEDFAKYSEVIQEVSHLPDKHVMVYDDFHLLQNPAILRFINQTMQILPKNTTVVLISRSMPDFNLIRMIMDENIFTINEEPLRFTKTEIITYFNQLELQVDKQHIWDIWEDTKGWAFAINLIGRSLINEIRYDRYVLEAMKGNILRFIEFEINPLLSDRLLRLMVRISLINHFATSLIKSLAKDDVSIKEIECLNAYVRYDFHLDAYVIHPLFLNCLQQKQNILTDREKYETYQIAAQWCESNNYEVDALFYYEKSGDYDAIMCLISTFHLQVSQDIARCALDILCRMPENVKAEHPLFPLLDLKLNISMGFLEKASILVEQYAKEFEVRPETPQNNWILTGIYGTWGFLRLILSPYTGVYDFDRYLQKQRIYFEKSSHKPPIDLYTKQSIGTYALLVGSSCSGAPDEYIKAIERSIPHILHVFKENLEGLYYLAKGELSFMRRNIDNAEKNLKQALDKARIHRQYDVQIRALFHLMYIAFFRGDFSAAKDTLDTMEALLYEKEYSLRFAAYDISNGFYHLMLDQPERVPAWLKGDFSRYTHPAFLENYANWVKAQYHYKTGQYNILLAFIENEWEQQAVLFSKIVFKILKALSLYQLKRRKEAIAALTTVYQLAAPNQIVSPFIHYAKDMRTLTAAASRDETCEIPKDWLEDINRKASAFAKKQIRMISEYKIANNLDEKISLTKRETEVLKDLSHGLSRSEIAANQNISVNTVKMVINIIYEKLHINNLAEAIRIASRRNMI